MSNITPFNFQGSEIRLVGTADKPEWVAADIIAILYPESDPNNRSTYLRGIPDEWVSLRSMQGNRGDRNMKTVFEPGLYYLLARSDSPLAVPFQRWVFEDVLPSIRKTGGYGVLREFKHPLLTLPEAVAVTEAVALVDDANSGPVGAIDAICDAIDPSFKRYNQDEIGTKFLDTLNGVGKYFEHRNKLADALLILPKRLENLSEHILTYIESCPNREAHWLDIAKGIPHLGDVYEIWEPQNQHRKSQLSLLIRAVCDHLESQGKGKWKGDTFHLK